MAMGSTVKTTFRDLLTTWGGTVKNTFIDFPVVPELKRTRSGPAILFRAYVECKSTSCNWSLREDSSKNVAHNAGSINSGIGFNIKSDEFPSRQTSSMRNLCRLSEANAGEDMMLAGAGSSDKDATALYSSVERVCAASALAKGTAVDKFEEVAHYAQRITMPSGVMQRHEFFGPADAEMWYARKFNKPPNSNPETSTRRRKAFPKVNHSAGGHPSSLCSDVVAGESWSRRRPEYHGRILVGIEEDEDFRIVKRLIGPAGRNTKAIVDKSGGAQVSIRGRGSSSKKETSTEPLSVYVTATQERSFELASKLVMELVERLHSDYGEFCERLGRSSRRMAARMETLRAA